MYKVGSAIRDITILLDGCGMLGYGMFHNVTKSIETPIYARAFVIEQGSQKIAFVNAEVCFITMGLKDAIVAYVSKRSQGWSHDNIMITAQHTHSAPGGFTHYFFYNITVSGFKQEVFDHFTEGIAEVILAAEEKVKPSKIFMGKGTFDEKVDVAFNRSLKPYNANKEVRQKVRKNEAHLAVDREMKMLRFEGDDGRPIGCLNWFGVHTTSISNDNTSICSDNKGYAADYFEKAYSELFPGKEKIISIFAQDTAGDVTPNYVWDKRKKWTRGRYEDDFESARYNGQLQFEKAREIFEKALSGKAITGQIDYETIYVDFSRVKVAPRFADGKKHQRTANACLGVSFLEGTREGPGMSKAVGHFGRFSWGLAKLYRKYLMSHFMPYKEKVEMLNTFKSQYPKSAILEMGTGHVMGTKQVRRLIIPAFADPVIRYFKYLDKTGYTKFKPWSPEVLPLQIMIIGEFAIVGVPAEMTTMAGQRLRNTVKEVLTKRGVSEVMLSTYANGYAGYTTTHEEYMFQHYEGGHTLFGKWTLAAYQTRFEELAGEMLRPKELRFKGTSFDEEPPAKPRIFDKHEIWHGVREEDLRIFDTTRI
ncbi:MAG: neutral/alkaline non-lysosomal ceramidase N-terminal domain-containing protein [Bacteroidota bacterium]